VGCALAASAARLAVGDLYNYSITKYNCHQFISECLTGGVAGPEYMSSPDYFLSTLTGLKLLCRDGIDSDNWRVWDR